MVFSKEDRLRTRPCQWSTTPRYHKRQGRHQSFYERYKPKYQGCQSWGGAIKDISNIINSMLFGVYGGRVFLNIIHIKSITHAHTILFSFISCNVIN